MKILKYTFTSIMIFFVMGTMPVSFANGDCLTQHKIASLTQPAYYRQGKKTVRAVIIDKNSIYTMVNNLDVNAILSEMNKLANDLRIRGDQARPAIKCLKGLMITAINNKFNADLKKLDRSEKQELRKKRAGDLTVFRKKVNKFFQAVGKLRKGIKYKH